METRCSFPRPFAFAARPINQKEFFDYEGGSDSSKGGLAVIRNEREYEFAKQRLQEDCNFMAAQRQALLDQGLSSEEVERVLEPTESLHLQLVEEVQWYERVKRRDFDVLHNLRGLGRLFITLRIANDLSQKELADRLGVSEA